jgi:hypothetical protein
MSSAVTPHQAVAAANPLPLPSPPRVACVKPRRRLLAARIAVGLFFILGPIFLSIPALRLMTQWVGTPIRATVDRLDVDSDSDGDTYFVYYHYPCRGITINGRQQVRQAEFYSRHVGDELTGRSLLLFNYPFTLTNAGDPNHITRELLIFGLAWTVFTGFCLVAVVVTQRRQRWLVENGLQTTLSAVAGRSIRNPIALRSLTSSRPSARPRSCKARPALERTKTKPRVDYR